jgi:hypothetical protein
MSIYSLFVLIRHASLGDTHSNDVVNVEAILRATLPPTMLQHGQPSHSSDRAPNALTDPNAVPDKLARLKITDRQSISVRLTGLR